jgi:hypothetical protein
VHAALLPFIAPIMVHWGSAVQHGWTYLDSIMVVTAQSECLTKRTRPCAPDKPSTIWNIGKVVVQENNVRIKDTLPMIRKGLGIP